MVRCITGGTRADPEASSVLRCVRHKFRIRTHARSQANKLAIQVAIDALGATFTVTQVVVATARTATISRWTTSS